MVPSPGNNQRGPSDYALLKALSWLMRSLQNRSHTSENIIESHFRRQSCTVGKHKPFSPSSEMPNNATVIRHRITTKQEATQAGDPIKHAATQAAGNVPQRRKNRARKAPHGIFHGGLVQWKQLPDFLKDNEYIVGYYRPEQSLWASLKTLFALHNETGNVWTHFLGFFLFVGLAFYFYQHPPTPLAVTTEHVEALLQDMQHQLQQQLHSLQVGNNLQALGHGLSQRVHAMEHSLQDKVHALEDRLSASFEGKLHTIQENIHSLQDNLQAVWQGSGLQDKVHHLQDSLHNVEQNLQHKAAGLSSNIASKAGLVHAALLEQLKPVVQWPVPRWPVYVYFAGAMVCLLTSSICHLLGCCQKHITEMVWRFDYAGIAVLIMASFVPAVYYAFLCQPWYRNFYLITTVTMGCVVIGMSLPSKFQAPQYRALRAGLFTGLGLWGVVPISHLLIKSGHVWALRQAFQLDILMGAVYIGGAVIFASRVPERWYPGRFDMMGHSHQLWHAAVVLAAWVHYCAIMILLQWRDASGGCAAGGAGVHGPVLEVLSDMRQHGRVPLGIEQVYDAMSQRLHEFVARRGL